MLKRNLFSRVALFLITNLLGFGLFIPGAVAESEAERYLIGPGDLLNIYVWKEAELTQDITVMPDGRISFPLIGEIVAGGKTVTELKGEISKLIEKFVTAPEVTVIVKESRSRRIYTIGKVVNPGPYPLAPNMSVLQALSSAGGFAEWADEKNVLIIRRDGDKETQIPFNYKSFIAGKDPESNIRLKPNDTIVVP